MIRNDDTVSLAAAEPGVTGRRVLTALAWGLGAVFLVGVLAGMAAAHTEAGGGMPSWKLVTIALSIAALLGFVAWRGVRTVNAMRGERLSSSTQRARRLIMVMVLISLVIVVLVPLDPDNPSALLTPSPWVYAGLALWLVPLPILSWLWWRDIDEHERTAYKDGALAALSLYSVVLPAWYVAGRIELLPPPGPLGVYVVLMVVWTAVYTWRRYA